jgi:hypothetical protein
MNPGSVLEHLNFVLPTLSSTEMSKDEQGAILVNQATAIIIAAWLAHRAVGMTAAANTTAGNVYAYAVSAADLKTAIEDIQSALATF